MHAMTIAYLLLLLFQKETKILIMMMMIESSIQIDNNVSNVKIIHHFFAVIKIIYPHICNSMMMIIIKQ